MLSRMSFNVVAKNVIRSQSFITVSEIFYVKKVMNFINKK